MSCRLTRVMSLIPLQLEKNRIPCTKEASFYEIYSEGLFMLEPMSLFVNLHLLHRTLKLSFKAYCRPTPMCGCQLWYSMYQYSYRKLHVAYNDGFRQLFHEPIIIIIISTTMFMALSSWQSHCESSPGSFDECIMATSGRRPKTKPDDLGCESSCTGCQKLHPRSPFIITQPES